MIVQSTGLKWGFASAMGRAAAARTLLAGAFALGFVLLIAYAERRAGLFGAASRALADRVFGALLPIFLLAGSTRILSPVRLDRASSAAARFGASRRAAALGMVLASMLSLAVFAALAAAGAAWIAHDPTAPPRVVDGATSGWIGALTAVAYAALFDFGARFGARGGGRFAALVADLALGSSVAAAPAILAPSTHAQNLLGGAAPLGLAQSSSALCLFALAVGFTGLAIYRCPP